MQHVLGNEIDILKEQLQQSNNRIPAAEKTNDNGQPAKEASARPSAAETPQQSTDSNDKPTRKILTSKSIQGLCDSVRRDHTESDSEDFVTARESSVRDAAETTSVARLSQADTTPELNTDGYRRNNQMQVPNRLTTIFIHGCSKSQAIVP